MQPASMEGTEGELVGGRTLVGALLGGGNAVAKLSVGRIYSFSATGWEEAFTENP